MPFDEMHLMMEPARGLRGLLLSHLCPPCLVTVTRMGPGEKWIKNELFGRLNVIDVIRSLICLMYYSGCPIHTCSASTVLV
jgi:hypothetical protein